MGIKTKLVALGAVAVAKADIAKETFQAAEAEAAKDNFVATIDKRVAKAEKAVDEAASKAEKLQEQVDLAKLDLAAKVDTLRMLRDEAKAIERAREAMLTENAPA